MSKLQDGYVKVDGLKIHYYRTGGDLPPLVLSHGALDDGLCWPRVVEALRVDFDLILPDLRGHGLSDEGAGNYSSEARAADLIDLIEALGLEKPVIGGHSLGADSSLQVAVRRPDLVSGFFLEDPPYTMPGEPLFGGPAGQGNQLSFKRLVRALKLIQAAPSFISVPLAKWVMPTAGSDVITPWLDSKRRVSEDFVRALEAPSLFRGGLDADLMDRVSIPGLLIYGDRDKGAIVSEPAARYMQDRIQGLRVVHLPGATHDIRRTQFDGYLTAVRDFLQDILK